MTTHAVAHDVVHEHVKATPAATTWHEIGIFQRVVDCDDISHANPSQSQASPKQNSICVKLKSDYCLIL